MAEEKEVKVPDEVLAKVKMLKKTDKMIKKLSDDDVDGVAGGFRQRPNTWASGAWIECPNCGCNVREGIASWEDDDLECSCFYCAMCDTLWAVDEWGYEWDPFY